MDEENWTQKIMWYYPLKKSLTSVFFINQFPPGGPHGDHFEFLRSFAEVLENKGLTPVSTTPAKNEKKTWYLKFFSYFVGLLLTFIYCNNLLLNVDFEV